MSPYIKLSPKRKIFGWEGLLVNPCQGDIARKFQLFHIVIALWEDNSYQFNILGAKSHLYKRYCTGKGIFCVKNKILHKDSIIDEPLLSKKFSQSRASLLDVLKIMSWTKIF